MRRTTVRLLLAMLLILALAIVALGGALAWVLGSETGTAWSLRHAQSFAPGLTLPASTGSWRDGIRIPQLRYATESVEIVIAELDIAVSVQPWRRRLQVPVLTAGRVDIRQLPTSEPEPRRAERLDLPAFSLPLPVEIPALQVATVSYTNSGDGIALTHLRARLAMAGAVVRWHDLALTWETRQLTTSGWLQLHDNYPLQADARLSEPTLELESALALSGNLGDLHVYGELSGPAALRAELRIDALDPELPFWLDAQLIERLMPGLDGMAIDAASLRLEGTLGITAAADGELGATLALPSHDSATLHMPLNWSNSAVQARPTLQLGAEGALGTASFNCNVAASAPWPLTCAGGVTRVSLAPWLGDGVLSSDVRLRVDDWQQLTLEAALPTLTGTLRNHAIRGRLTLAGADGQWRLDDAQLAIGDNQLQINGALGTDSNLHLQLNAPALNQLHRDFGGALQITARATGALSEPSIALTGTARKLRWQEITIGGASLTADLGGLGQGDSTLRLQIDALQSGEQTVGHGQLQLDGNRDRHRIVLDGDDVVDGTKVTLGCNGRLAPAAESYRLRCDETTIQLALGGEPDWHWRLQQALQLDWHGADGSLSVSPFCLAADDSRLCLAAPLQWRDNNLRGALTLSDLPVARLIAAPAESGFALTNRPLAHGRITLGSLRPLRLDAEVEIEPTGWRWSSPEGPASGELGPIAATLTADDRRALLRLATSGTDLGTLQADISVMDPMGARRLDGQIALETLQLAPLGWLAPDFQLEGILDARLGLSGTLAKPAVSGQLELQDGRLAPPGLGQPIEAIALTVGFDTARATLDGRFLLGPGLGHLSGSAVLPGPEQPWQLDLQVTGDDLQIQPLPGSVVRVNPNIALAATPDRFDITGQIAVDQAEIRLQSLPPDTAAVSPDAEWVGAEQAQTQPAPLYADIALALGRRTHFEGFGADLQLRGALRLRHSPRLGLRLQGQVEVPAGRYRAYGQRLVVRRGTLLFTGTPANPELNLEAIREMPPTVHDQVAGIRVTGPLQNPTAALFAEPGMPESDIAYMLLTGRPRPADGSGSQISAAGALLTLGLAGTGDQTQQLAERFGIDDFQISTRETESGTEATVSGYLTERLYVRYGAGLRDGANSITFQYRLTPKLVLEAISGLEDALDLLYSFSID